jgi:hypothetical protein
MNVEKLRRKYFRRNDLQNLDPKRARLIKRDLRVGRTKIRKLNDNEPFKAEALALFDITIAAMHAVANNEDNAGVLLDASRERFEHYVNRMKGVV